MGATHRLVALDLAAYGAALLDLDRVDEAEAGFRQALDIFRSRHPADRYEVAANPSNLAVCQLRRSDLRAALTFRRTVLGDDHPEAARQFNNLAVALDGQGRTTAADELQRQALDIARTHLPRRHPLVDPCRDNPPLMTSDDSERRHATRGTTTNSGHGAPTCLEQDFKESDKRWMP